MARAVLPLEPCREIFEEAPTMNRIAQRGFRVFLLVTLAAASLASTAAADRGHDRRHDRGGPPTYGYRTGYGPHWRPVFIERHSSVGPALAGFLGGLVLGSVIADAHPAPPPPPPPPVYDYYDPYCHERFASFAAYENHLRYHDHPWVIDVIDAHSGRYVDSCVWQDGRWLDGQDRADQPGEGAE
jgi:hypothetical protein